MKELHNLVNIIPVIAKSDTLTQTEVRTLKTRVRHSLLISCTIHILILFYFYMYIHIAIIILFLHSPSLQILQEISDNGIKIYNGEIDEEDDSPEIRELRVSLLSWQHTDSALLFLAGCYPNGCGRKHHFTGGWE